MRELITMVLCVGLLCLGNSALALKKVESSWQYCDLSEDVLANPDYVMQNLLEVAAQNYSRACSRRLAIEQDDPRLGTFPAKASKHLHMFGWGIFRDSRVLSKIKGPLVDGYDTLIFTVEFVYVYAVLANGIAPICERSIVPIRLIRTPWGWYPDAQYGFGSSIWGHALDGHDKSQVIPNARRMNRESLSHCPLRLDSKERTGKQHG